MILMKLRKDLILFLMIKLKSKKYKSKRNFFKIWIRSQVKVNWSGKMIFLIRQSVRMILTSDNNSFLTKREFPFKLNQKILFWFNQRIIFLYWLSMEIDRISKYYPQMNLMKNLKLFKINQKSLNKHFQANNNFLNFYQFQRTKKYTKEV